MMAGTSTAPTAASTGSVTKIHTPATTNRTTTPEAKGMGASTSVAASGSALAWASSSPVGLARWYSKGRAWYWRTTCSRRVASMRYLATEAMPLRSTMADALTSPTPRMATAPTATVPAATEPSSNRGITIWSVTRPIT